VSNLVIRHRIASRRLPQYTRFDATVTDYSPHTAAITASAETALLKVLSDILCSTETVSRLYARITRPHAVQRLTV